MSIASEISRIQTAKDDLKDAINAKGGNLTVELLDDYAAAVTALPTGGGETDLSFVTASAGDILSGKVGADASGNPVHGTIVSQNAAVITPGTSDQTVAPGTYLSGTLTVKGEANLLPENIRSGTSVFGVTGTLSSDKTDLSFVTASAGDILSGKVGADTSGNPVHGTIVSQSAAVITPGTSDQTVASGTYLSGALTVKGDADLLPENIRSGTSVFGVTGTFTGVSFDYSFISARSEHILAGFVGADENGNPVEGTIPNTEPQYLTGDPNAREAVIPPGYVPKELHIVLKCDHDGTSAMDFYKCAAVYGPREVTAFELSGCPLAEANGTYVPTEFTSSGWDGATYPVYKNAQYYYYYYEEDWGISTDYTAYPTYKGSASYWYDSDWMTIEGMSMSETTVTVDTEVPKTWDGYKAVLSNGKYTFESSLTTGLTYSENKPEVMQIYSSDAKVKADWLDTGDKFDKGLIFYAPLTDRLDYDETGQKLDNQGAVLTELNGVKCASFNGSSRVYCEPVNGNFPYGSMSFTAMINMRISGTGYQYSFDVTGSGDKQCQIHIFDNFGARIYASNNYADIAAGELVRDKWYTVILCRDKKSTWAMLGKTVIPIRNNRGSDVCMTQISIGATTTNLSEALNGYINQVRIYNRAFTYEEACEYVDAYGFA